tara:strand:- start:1022 stop:1216 length:195 start_codon:yes stop_codon:yes gene_type:complete
VVERLRKVGALCEKSVHVLTGGNILRHHEDRALDDTVKDLRILIAPLAVACDVVSPNQNCGVDF